jgi:Predicted AAA-ATPase/PD-(D/E)XK nuclease superfamily
VCAILRIFAQNSSKIMVKIPYGVSDFEKIRNENFFFQDRTQFIERLEAWDAPYLVFLRPRRFGKTLFLSILQSYYGLEYKDKFQSLFGNLYIGQKPTKRANTYFVLRFDFSRIDTATHESTYKGFVKNTMDGARDFFISYARFFDEEDKNMVFSEDSPEGIVKTLFSVTKSKQLSHKIYVLIDEYDHFANELLSFDMERFKSDISRNGFVRKIYESIKTATGTGLVDRIFITGVSPVTMDSLTSGFNISDNISLNPIFHDMMGFTHAEVFELLKKMNIPAEQIPTFMSDLKEWYNGYRFGRGSNLLFNPDMLLYFLKEYNSYGQYPEEMLDGNIVTDYRKIRNIFKIGGNEIERYELLDELVKIKHIDFTLTRMYNLEINFTDDDFLSLLFYMGMLTFKEPLSSDWRFEIPNYVIKKLYFEYFAAIYLEKTTFARSMRPITQSINAMMNEAKPEAFFKVVEYVLQENHSNRDEMVYGEKHLQTLMIALLFPYKAFKIHSEYESKRTYPDIFLARIPDRIINYEVVIELKYVKKSAAATVDAVVSEAKTQLEGYMQTERFSHPDVRGFYVVFLGGKIYKYGTANELMS